MAVAEAVRLRRLALAAQGLLQTQPYGNGLAGARNAINHLVAQRLGSELGSLG